MRFLIVLFVVLSFFSTASAQEVCRVYDFEELPAGTILSNQLAGLNATVQNNKGPDALLIFDSENPTGGDFDLGTPNAAFGGPGIGPGVGNDRALGKILIIAEDVVDSDGNGLVDDPDDDLDGGTFQFDFDDPVLLRRLTLVDFEEPGGAISGFLKGSLGGAPVFSVPINTPGDNSLQDILLDESTSVDRIEVIFPSSGSIGEIEVCCDQSVDSDADGVPDCLDQCPGADDSLLTQSCDGADSDSCSTGVYVCGAGNVLECTDNDAFDDADADGVSDCEEQCAGANDALLGTSCDGDDADSCSTGVYECAENGMLSCTDDSTLDDSDMDGVADCEDVCVGNDALIGVSCDGDDADECDGGVYTCASGSLECTDSPESADADNDGVADCVDQCASGNDSLIGTECDGSDSDSCKGGVFVCAESGELQCTDDEPIDDSDKDGTPNCLDQCAQGDDSLLGSACDGEDSDTCASGKMLCSESGMLECTDDAAFDDEDGDSISDCTDNCEGDQSLIGEACDGADSDSCLSGTFLCTSGVLECSDATALDDADMDGVADCDDACPDDPDKATPGICGCGVSELDTDGDGIPDCQECKGLCDSSNPLADEDQDGVSNCDELEAGTDACDGGSVITSLPNFACVGANFFLGQINIATVKNTSSEENLDVTVSYRDASGVEIGKATYWLMGGGRQDVIINELGAQADTYGTVCVEAHTSRSDAWDGQLIIYKPRYTENGTAAVDAQGDLVMDFALQYPFREALQGSSVVSLNTNVLGSASVAANWVRIFDGVAGDSVGVEGSLLFYDIDGKKISEQAISLPDGGRIDVAAHEVLGLAAVGAAEFIAAAPEVRFQLETTRYFYESELSASSATGPNFLTAFSIPLPKPSGALRSGYLSSHPDELSIVEAVNGLQSPVQAVLDFNKEGITAESSALSFSGRTSTHIIFGKELLSETERGSALLQAAKAESLTAISLIYHFSESGDLDYAAAMPFLSPGPARQITEFNTYLQQANELVSFNSTQKDITATVKLYDLMGQVIDSFELKVASGEILETPLSSLPAEKYGVVEVLADSAGLVVRNVVTREGQYTLSFDAR